MSGRSSNRGSVATARKSEDAVVIKALDKNTKSRLSFTKSDPGMRRPSA
jgi:hypothetical protein